MKDHVIQIDPCKCIGCSLCVNDCSVKNISIIDNKAKINSQKCIKCGHCVAVCPKVAVSMTGFDEPPIEFNTQPIVDPKRLLEALRARRSIRQFKDKSVPIETLEKIIEAGRWTPTAKNSPSVSFLVLQDKKSQAEALAVRFFRFLLPIAKLVYPAAKGLEIDDNFFFKGAPLVVSILSKDKISASLAASNMALMAESCGLGVLYSGFFTMAANNSLSLRKALALERKTNIVTTLVLGYPNVTYHRTVQKKPASVYFK